MPDGHPPAFGVGRRHSGDGFVKLLPSKVFWGLTRVSINPCRPALTRAIAPEPRSEKGFLGLCPKNPAPFGRKNFDNERSEFQAKFPYANGGISAIWLLKLFSKVLGLRRVAP